MRKLLVAAALLQILLRAAPGAVTFHLTYPDVSNDTNQHWDDPDHGPLLRSILQAALNEFGREFSETATIHLQIDSSMSTVYSASAGAASHDLSESGPFYDGSTYRKITTGVDVNGAAPDGYMEYSFNLAAFYTDKNGDGVVDLRDFAVSLKPLTRHEIIHVLGMHSNIYHDNPSLTKPARQDMFLYDSAGRPLINPDGTQSSTANFDDPEIYFDAIGDAPYYKITAIHDFSHFAQISIPFRPSMDDHDRNFFRTLDYAPGPSKLLNISTRVRVLSGDAVLIAGFIITGTEPKKVIIRGIGPSLGAVGVSGALADPTLELFQANTLIAANDNWESGQREEISATRLNPASPEEAAIVQILEPGAYTAIVRGKDGAIGVGVAEVYDLSSTSDSKLANISTRGFVESGDNVMIGGFIAGHPTSTTIDLVVRAIGPSLSAVGVPNALEDPTLSLHDGNGTLVVENDNWRDTQEGDINAAGFAPSNNAEAAILITRPPGNTTAIVRGKNGGVGNALVEVYRLR